ncbi:MAG: choice-of-anchor P family protein [Alcanivorax sp.]|nr:choice-of-anchor P family protein [Alcanivorax sp.]
MLHVHKLSLSHLLLAAIAAVMLVLSPTIEAKGPPSGKGGGGGGGSVTTTQYSGAATALNISLDTFLLGHTSVVLSDAGMLDASGGMQENSLVSVDQSGLVSVQATILGASTVGSGDLTHSQATIVGLHINVLGLLDIGATVLQSNAQMQCTSNGSVPTGSSVLAGLTINGQSINISGQPNQGIKIDGIASIIVNEQIADSNSITVNALHVKLLDSTLLYGAISADVVVSHAVAGILCGDTANCPVKDFITGGGRLQLDGGTLSFGMVGGLKANGLSGHFNAVDHRSGGPHITAHTLTDYQAVDSVTRQLTYDCNGVNSPCVITAEENVEPGSNDTLTIDSADFYANSKLIGGNLQLHTPHCGSSGGGGGGGGHGKKK